MRHFAFTLNAPIIALIVLLISAFALPGRAQNPTSAPATPAVQSATGKWLAEQEPRWQAAFASEVSGPFEKTVADLKKKYLVSVAKQFAAATKAAKLDDAVAFRTEHERMSALGSEMPAEDEALTPDSIKALRDSYRADFAKLDAARFAKAKAVHARFDAILAQNLTVLTQRQRLNEALELKAEREALATAWLKPPAGAAPEEASDPAKPKPALGQTMAPPASKAPKLKPREVFERLLAMGAQVYIMPGNRVVGKMEDLPGDKFTIGTVLFVKHEGLTEADLDIVEQLTDATDLDFNGVPATDATMEKVRRLPGVRGLSLQDLDKLTGASFKSIAAMPALGNLGLKVPVAPESLTALGKSKNLDTIRIFEPNVSEAHFASIAAIPRLKILQVNSVEPISPTAWARLAGAKNLFELNVSGTPITAEMITLIGKLAGLETLYAGTITLPDASLAPPSALKSLIYLNTNPTSTLDGSAFLTWPQRPAMKTLLLRSTRSVNDASLRAITAAFPKLTLLYVTANADSVTADGLSHLSKLRQLETLNITGDAVDDAGLAHIAKCNLLGLDLGNSRATEVGAHSLEKLSLLKTLSWANPPVTDAALKSYGKLRALATFTISKDSAPDIEQKLKAALPFVTIVR